jgi:hypothetical protein
MLLPAVNVRAAVTARPVGCSPMKTHESEQSPQPTATAASSGLSAMRLVCINSSVCGLARIELDHLATEVRRHDQRKKAGKAKMILILSGNFGADRPRRITPKPLVFRGDSPGTSHLCRARLSGLLERDSLGLQHGAVYANRPAIAPKRPIAARKTTIPMRRTAIKRKIRNQKQPLRPCRTTTTCGGCGGVVWPIAVSLGMC